MASSVLESEASTNYTQCSLGKYRIPKGATIVLAVWSANHNENDFDDPRDFRPERHNPDTSIFESSNSSSPQERGHWSFGSGKILLGIILKAHSLS